MHQLEKAGRISSERFGTPLGQGLFPSALLSENFKNCQLS